MEVVEYAGDSAMVLLAGKLTQLATCDIAQPCQDVLPPGTLGQLPEATPPTTSPRPPITLTLAAEPLANSKGTRLQLATCLAGLLETSQALDQETEKTPDRGLVEAPPRSPLPPT